MRPVTWQCAGTGWPATVSAPAAIALAAVMVVFAMAMRVTRSVQDAKVAPVAGVSCGSVEDDESLRPPQAATSSNGESRHSSRIGHLVDGRQGAERRHLVNLLN